MRKYAIITMVLVLALALCSCASKNAITDSKDYLADFYQNLNNGNATICFYQLNKNSCDMINTKYNLDAESFLSARSKILGQVKNHEILEESFAKDGDVKVVDLKVKVEYEKATVDETVQITIKKDGQTSINMIEFGEDSVIDIIKSQYTNALIENEFDAVLATISPYYFEKKTESDLENMIQQASNLGGKLLDYELIEGKYIYEELDKGAYVYEALIKMNYKNMPMLNKVKIINLNGNLGIAYTVVLPDKLIGFLDEYQVNLNNENKENLFKLYSTKLWGDSNDSKETWWKRLYSYSEAYGSLQEYEVMSMCMDTTEQDGKKIEVMRIDVDMQYEKKKVQNKFVLLNEKEYLILDQYFLDN